MPAPYQHLDMTPEYNRIITALTGIRDDVRLLQKLQSERQEHCQTVQQLPQLLAKVMQT
jgi:hypothetical protein